MIPEQLFETVDQIAGRMTVLMKTEAEQLEAEGFRTEPARALVIHASVWAASLASAATAPTDEDKQIDLALGLREDLIAVIQKALLTFLDPVNPP